MCDLLLNSLLARRSVEYYNPVYPHPRLLGVPVYRGQQRDGTQNGPELIRSSNLISCLETIGVKLEDCGDVDIEDINHADDPDLFGMIRPKSFITNSLKIADRIEELLTKPVYASNGVSDGIHTSSSPVVAIGGDHSCAAGTILGHKRVKPDACIIWVDAHADLNTPMTSSSGNMHGMPLAFLLNELQDEIPLMDELEPLKPCVKAQDIAYIGLRDLDPHEVYDIKKNGIVHFTMLDVDRMGIDNVIRQVVEGINPRLDRPIHLSIDIDSMDPTIAPSTGTPVSGGLTLREGLRICEELSATGLLSVIEMAELNPKLGSPKDVRKTQETAVQLLKTCLGYRRSGHPPETVQSLARDGIPARDNKIKNLE